MKQNHWKGSFPIVIFQGQRKVETIFFLKFTFKSIILKKKKEKIFYIPTFYHTFCSTKNLSFCEEYYPFNVLKSFSLSTIFNPGDESTFSLFLVVYLFVCLFVCFCFAFILGGVYACFASTYQSAQDPA